MGRPLKFVLNALHIVDPLALKIGFGDFFQFRETAHTLLLIVYDSATGVEVGRWQVDLPG